MSDLERDYSPSSRVGGSADPFIAGYEERSNMAESSLGSRIRRLAGGTLLVPPVEPDGPILVFVHGGYWQALSASASLFPAPALDRLGWGFAAVEYTLAPHASIGTMVDGCAAALEHIVDASPGRGRLVLAGHSAGGHLVAMTALARAAPVRVDRVVLVSGVYDLRPLVHTTVNDVLALTEETASSLSPALVPVVGSAEVVVAWGDNETDAFKAQSRTFAEHVRHAGRSVQELECAGRHHFDIVDDLADPSSALGSLTLGDLTPGR